LYSRALEACSPTAPQRSIYLSDLGTVYRLRYLNAGQLRDLERAIASMDEAIALTEPNAPGWGALLTTRGLLCLDAYHQTGLLASVNDGISLLYEAAIALSPGAPCARTARRPWPVP